MGGNLWGANLGGANLGGARGNQNNIKSIFLDTYPITYTDEYLQIGCEKHLIKDWWKFDEDRIRQMDGQAAVDWWAKYKTFVKRAIKLSPAKPTGYVEKQEDAA